MSIDAPAKAKRVRIYLGEGDRIGARSASLALLELFRDEGAMGATVLRGVSGFGAAGEIQTLHLADVAPRLPVVVEWVDRPEAVARLLPRLAGLVPGALVTVDETEVVQGGARAFHDVPGALTAGDVMTRPVVAVSRETPLREAVEKLLGKLYQALPVVEGGAPVGILTDGDLVEKGGLGVRLDLLHKLDRPELHDVLERLAREPRTVGEVMTPGPVTVRAETPLREVALLMARRRLKRLPVVDGAGALVGMVSRVDLLRSAGAGLAAGVPVARPLGLTGDAPLSSVMRREVPVVHPETPLGEVFQAVVATRLQRALVVDGERRVLGVVTDAELLERVTPALRPGALRSLAQRLPFRHGAREAGDAAQHARARTAAELMTTSFASARADALLSEGIRLMLAGHHKILAVTDAEGRLLGVVDRADLLHGLVAPLA